MNLNKSVLDHYFNGAELRSEEKATRLFRELDRIIPKDSSLYADEVFRNALFVECQKRNSLLRVSFLLSSLCCSNTRMGTREFTLVRLLFCHIQ